MIITLPYGRTSQVDVNVPDENLYFEVDRREAPALRKPEEAIRREVRASIREFSSVFSKATERGVLLLVDDITRPTPHRAILPPLLDELKKTGVRDEDIRILIALGTHRGMSDREIDERYGETVRERVTILNHDFRDRENLVDAGKTGSGIPIIVNKMVFQHDFVIGIGNIAPHNFAGWCGGGKIVLPGVCGEETTGMVHYVGGKIRPITKLAGNVDNVVRMEIDEVATKAGLDMIVNTILNEKEEISALAVGRPLEAFRRGVEQAEGIYCPKIPGYTDIVVFSTYPADIDYWQAMKALDFACLAVKPGGTIIMVTPCPERISPTHPSFRERATCGYNEIIESVERKEIHDPAVGGALLQHSQILERAMVICYSSGLTGRDKKDLGFLHASTLDEAIRMALERQGKDAKIGVLRCGEIAPVVAET